MAKRLALVEGQITKMPELPGLFDKNLAVNSLQFDGMTCETLTQITRHLAADAVFAMTFQPRGKNPTVETSLSLRRQSSKSVAKRRSE